MLFCQNASRFIERVRNSEFENLSYRTTKSSTLPISTENVSDPHRLYLVLLGEGTHFYFFTLLTRTWISEKNPKLVFKSTLTHRYPEGNIVMARNDPANIFRRFLLIVTALQVLSTLFPLSAPLIVHSPIP